MSKIALIGGSGLYQISGLKVESSQQIETPFGPPSADYVCGHFDHKEVVFLARHGNPHRIPPHKINYRANLWGLKQLGVTEVIAIAAVGGITNNMPPAHIAIPDQIIDYSYGRDHTFFAEDLDTVTHIDFTNPYNPLLRNRLITAANKANLQITDHGTYGCTQGPRLESSAEIQRLQQDGCHLVGMTGMPEAALAKEIDLNYACIAVVANWAAGKSEDEITMAEIEKNLQTGMGKVLTLLTHFISA